MMPTSAIAEWGYRRWPETPDWGGKQAEFFPVPQRGCGDTRVTGELADRQYPLRHLDFKRT
jgi:hypothetical protein